MEGGNTLKGLGKRGYDRERILAEYEVVHSRQDERVSEGFGAMTLAKNVVSERVERAVRIRGGRWGVAKPALAGVEMDAVKLASLQR